jgi:hypothetical protein
LEVYYVRGHKDTTPNMDRMLAMNIEGKGIVITKVWKFKNRYDKVNVFSKRFSTRNITFSTV